MKIKQLISYPNPNELGLGNTNETYIRIENGLDVSDIFPPYQEVEVVDCLSHKTFLLKAKNDREFRINQLGSLYRDFNVYPGDEIKFTQIDNGKKTVFFSVVNYNRIYLNVTSKGTEIVNIERLSQYVNANNNEFIVKINAGTLKLTFDKSERKRSDSPTETDFYKMTVNDVDVEKGSYYITIQNGKNIFEEVKKNRVEEYIISENGTNNINAILNEPLQQIFYGAPGTGKSNTIKKDVEDKGRIHFRTTFHPDSDYSTFVGCYKPTMVEAPVRDGSGHEVTDAKQTEKKRISYSFVPQAFTKAYCEAWNKFDGSNTAEPVFLIIEEINRGNCAQIFGDIFQLLDREVEGDRCGFSTYPIDADEDLKDFLEVGTTKDGTQWLTNKEGIKDGKLCLPPNFYIWATMNTSDQSLFPIDSAFKRRWNWKYMPIDTKKENWTIKIDDKDYSWSLFLEKINEEIDSTTHSEDKMLGFYFCRANNNVIDADKFVSKVLFYLYNDVFKDYGLDRELFKGDDGKTISFRSYYKIDGHIDTDKVKKFLDNLKVNEKGNNPATADAVQIEDNV